MCGRVSDGAQNPMARASVPSEINPFFYHAQEDVACNTCGKARGGDHMLLCDGCETGAAHIYCLQPPLAEVPPGDWFCPRCAPSRSSRPAATPATAPLGESAGHVGVVQAERSSPLHACFHTGCSRCCGWEGGGVTAHHVHSAGRSCTRGWTSYYAPDRHLLISTLSWSDGTKCVVQHFGMN